MTWLAELPGWLLALAFVGAIALRAWASIPTREEQREEVR